MKLSTLMIPYGDSIALQMPPPIERDDVASAMMLYWHVPHPAIENT